MDWLIYKKPTPKPNLFPSKLFVVPFPEHPFPSKREKLSPEACQLVLFSFLDVTLSLLSSSSRAVATSPFLLSLISFVLIVLPGLSKNSVAKVLVVPLPCKVVPVGFIGKISTSVTLRSYLAMKPCLAASQHLLRQHNF